MDPMSWIPAPPVSDATRGLGIVSIVTGILGILFLPIVFGPIALVTGILAVSQHHRAAWWGVTLGALEVAVVAYGIFQLSEALNSL